MHRRKKYKIKREKKKGVPSVWSEKKEPFGDAAMAGKVKRREKRNEMKKKIKRPKIYENPHGSNQLRRRERHGARPTFVVCNPEGVSAIAMCIYEYHLRRTRASWDKAR